jgi:sulfatase modifying factor 1
MKVFSVSAFFLAMLLLTVPIQAVTIPTVSVGNPSNPADTRYDATGFGSVDHSFRIGTYEVTNSQYVGFLNSVDPTGANSLALYNSAMTSDARGGIIFTGNASDGSKYSVKVGGDNNPVVFVSWYDAIRFANWLNNGQGSSDTESGTYTLLGGTPVPSNANSITRNVDAKWWLPSEDEWYKAAYHKNDGVTANYWNYPTSTNAVPYSDQPPGTGAPDPSNTANVYNNDTIANGYNDGYAVTGSAPFINSQNYLTDVGAYTFSVSPYGTFDQGGNVWEWNESTISGSSRALRGGSWGAFALHPSQRLIENPTGEFEDLGFRVASIPEPINFVLYLTGMMMLPLRRCRR